MSQMPNKVWPFLFAVLLACSSSSSNGTTPDSSTGVDTDESDGSSAPILTATHGGWSQPRCELCHSLPEEGHDTTLGSECAPCHGGNGACDPNGTGLSHTSADDCVTCHQTQHDYSASEQCQSCHFSTVGGVVACGDVVEDEPDAGGDIDSDDVVTNTDTGPAPELSTEVVSNCMNWPETEFSETNHAQIETLDVGTLAIELELDDVDGQTYRLSDLLAERPVLMVYGAYT